MTLGRTTALQLDICETHRKISVLRIISKQPAIETLIHHRGCNREMQRRPARRSFSGGGRATVAHGLWIQLSLDRRRVIDNLQMRTAGELPEITRMLRTRRMMQKFRGIAFHDPINIVHAKLAFIDEEPISWRFAFEKRDCPFVSPNSADKRPDQECNDTQMRDEKREMMFTPRPARERGTGKIRPEQDKPDIEPWRPINISARNLRIEA